MVLTGAPVVRERFLIPNLESDHFSFEATGSPEIDRILGAIACAGRAFSHTNWWGEDASRYNDGYAGDTPVQTVNMRESLMRAADLLNRLISHHAPGGGIREELILVRDELYGMGE